MEAENILTPQAASSTFLARENAVCIHCGNTIKQGTPITWNRKKAGAKYHPNCLAAEMAAEKVAAPAPVAAPATEVKAPTDKLAWLVEQMRIITREEIAAALAPATTAKAAPMQLFIHPVQAELEMMMELGLKPYLKGPAGSGKTHAVEAVAAKMDLDYIPMQFDGFTSPILIKGYMDAQGKFSSTPVYEWLKSEGGLLFVDEMDRGREDTLVCFNSLLANGYQMFANGEILRMGPKHFVVAAGNTAMKGSDGAYTSAKKQDASVLDRFVTVNWGYDTALELSLAENIGGNNGIAWAKWVQAVRVFLARPDSGVKESGIIAGMRVIMQGATLLARVSPSKAAEYTLWNKGISEATKDRILANVPLPRF